MKYFDFFLLSFICFTFSINANAVTCAKIGNGVYVQDNDSDAQLDGGKSERVLSQVSSKDVQPKYAGTTFHFGHAFVINDKDTKMYSTISNAIDEKYESLSILTPVAVKVECNGIFSFDYEITHYYPNEIKIGLPPTKTGKTIRFPLKVNKEGVILPDGNLRINKCQAFEQRESGRRKTSDDLGLCNGAARGYLLFNIKDKIAGKPGWDAIKK